MLYGQIFWTILDVFYVFQGRLTALQSVIFYLVANKMSV